MERRTIRRFELKEKLSDFMVFGVYPEVLTAPDQRKRMETLTEIANSYLLKDILHLIASKVCAHYSTC